jgi:hypothetical protein
MSLCRLFAFLIALSALSLSSCGGASAPSRLDNASLAGTGQQLASAPAGGFPQLPTPHELYAAPQQAPRSASQVYTLFIGYAGMQPHSRVSTSGGNSLLMEPDYVPGGPASGLAYCLETIPYSEDFPLDDIALRFDANDLVQQGSADDLFVGYANYVRNRWDWFQFSALPGKAGPAALGEYEPPAESSFMYIALVARGSAAFELKGGQFGNDPPSFGLSAFPDNGKAPLEVHFTASHSDFEHETRVKLEWDFDGDGVYELETAPDVLEQTHIYETAGVFNASARMTDNEGATATETVTITVSENVIRTWGTSGDDTGFGVAQDSLGNVYVCGESNSTAVLLKFDSELELQWAKSWEPSGTNSFSSYRTITCIGEDVYVGGYALVDDGPPNHLDAILHKYSGDGTLSFQKTYGHASEDDQIRSLVTDGTSLYIAGDTWDSVNEFNSVLMAKLASDGSVTWGKQGSAGSAPFYNSAGAIAIEGSNAYFLATPVGEFDYSPACVVNLNSGTGATNWQNYYVIPTDPDMEVAGKGLAASPGLLAISGDNDNGFDEGVFVLLVASNGFPIAATLSDSNADIAYGGVSVAGSGLGGLAGGNAYDAFLLFPTQQSSLPFLQLDGPASYTSRSYGITTTGDGVFYTTGYADHADATWGADTANLELDPPSFSATPAGISLTDWTPNMANSATAAADISGTLDTGGGFQDILISKVKPGVGAPPP